MSPWLLEDEDFDGIVECTGCKFEPEFVDLGMASLHKNEEPALGFNPEISYCCFARGVNSDRKGCPNGRPLLVGLSF
jgi:hypothetical protein